MLDESSDQGLASYDELMSSTLFLLLARDFGDLTPGLDETLSGLLAIHSWLSHSFYGSRSRCLGLSARWLDAGISGQRVGVRDYEEQVRLCN